MDLVGQSQRESIAIYRLLVSKGVATREELDVIRAQVDSEVKPLRDQLLDLIRRAKDEKALEELLASARTRPQ
jgi:hypothetical protein